METLTYLLLAAIVYGFLAEGIDRAVNREMRKRRDHAAELHLVDDDEADFDLQPWGHRGGQPAPGAGVPASHLPRRARAGCPASRQRRLVQRDRRRAGAAAAKRPAPL